MKIKLLYITSLSLLLMGCGATQHKTIGAAEVSDESTMPKTNVVEAPIISLEEYYSDEPSSEFDEDGKELLIKYAMRTGPLREQIEGFITNYYPGNRVVWNLDTNTQWWGDIDIKGATQKKVLAKILKEYDAVAEFYLNQVVVVSKKEGIL